MKVTEGVNLMTVKVSVLGSCVSRDIFNRKFIANYKDFFRCSSYQHHISFISLMSEPIPYDDRKLKNNSFSDLTETQLVTELDKSPLKDLISVQPEFILIDFYADMLYGAVKVNGSNLTGKMFKFSKSDLYEDLNVQESYFPRKNFLGFYEVWKPKFDAFMKFKEKFLPNSTIIINKARASNLLLDLETGKVTETRLNYDVSLLNSIWEKLDEYAINKYDLDCIDYNKAYFLDKNYIFGEGIVHFHHEFYQDCFNKLLKIVFDHLNDHVDEKKEIPDYSLVINGNFKKNLDFWFHKKGNFEVVNEDDFNYLHVRNVGNEKNIKSQIWSNSVQVDSCKYELSFDIKAKELDGRKIIFCVRSFKDRKKNRFKDSIDSIDISIDEVNLVSEEWTHCSFILKFNGPFVRIAPFVFKNGDVSWKNIKLKRYETK